MHKKPRLRHSIWIQRQVQDMVKIFKQRHDYIVRAINEIPASSPVYQVKAHFYAFIHAEDFIAKRHMKDDIRTWPTI